MLVPGSRPTRGIVANIADLYVPDAVRRASADADLYEKNSTAVVV